MQQQLNIILTDNVTSFKMVLPFKASLPYLFDHEIKHLVCNLAHPRFADLFLSTQDKSTTQEFNNRYESIFLSSDAISTQYFKNIINDIKRLSYPKNSIVDLLINAEVFDHFNKPNLTSWVEMIYNLAFDKQIFINLFVFGANVTQQTLSHALANSSLIKTLSIIKVLHSNILTQEVIFAHSETGVIVNQTQEHTQLNNGYQTSTTSSKNKNKVERTVTTRPDQIYTTKDLFSDEEFAPKFFKVFEKFDDVCDAIPKNITSTVILPCNKYTDIKKLAHFAYRLKKNYNAETTLIIREMNQCIRYSDEQFLLHSGVNLVIPIGIPFSRVLGQITAIQNHSFNLQLPTSLESLTDLRSQFDFQGHYQVKEFKKFVLETTSKQSKRNIEYALVRLDVISDMPIYECIKFCQIKRNGDIYTTFTDAIYIFFSAIRPNDIALALNNVLGLNVSEFFLGYEIFDKSLLVHDELRIMAEKKEFLPTDNTVQDDPSLQFTTETSEQFLFARKSNFIRSNKGVTNEYS